MAAKKKANQPTVTVTVNVTATDTKPVAKPPADLPTNTRRSHPPE